MPASSKSISSNPAPTDEALLADVRARDAEALKRLYDRHSPAVFALCLRIVSDHPAAEEVTLDVFTELWEKADRFDASRGSPVGYILGLARSRATDRLRRGQAQKASAAGGAHNRPSLSGGPSLGFARSIGGDGTAGATCSSQFRAGRTRHRRTRFSPAGLL